MGVLGWAAIEELKDDEEVGATAKALLQDRDKPK